MSEPRNLSRIIPLDRDLSVEVSVSESEVQKLSGSVLTTKLENGLALIRGAIRDLASEAAASIREIRDGVEIKEIEIEAGLGIQAEGTVYIAKGTGSANLKVKFTMKPISENKC